MSRASAHASYVRRKLYQDTVILPSLAIERRGKTVVHGAIGTSLLNFYMSRAAETGDALLQENPQNEGGTEDR